jgi:hypothetical protein
MLPLPVFDRRSRRTCSMIRRNVLPWPMLAVLLLSACSDRMETPVSPSLGPPAGLDANPDGSTLKVHAPTGLAPSGGTAVEGNEVRLTFQPASGRHVQPFGVQYHVELFDQRQQRIQNWTTPATSVTTAELNYTESYSWRARATVDGQTGPWSDTAAFVVPAPPTPPECLRQPLENNRLPCIFAVAAKSDDWPRCQAGSGTACHRFTREVARALAVDDPLWGLLGKAPGTWQCTTSACGSNVVGGLGEDVIVYCTNPASCRNPSGPDGRMDWVAIDIVLAAGLPGAQI